ncbi:MAG: site-2 protease family protein [Gemmataceae bacterium]|nr:site-2 protease family protein [Gemmataceae bacterium]
MRDPFTWSLPFGRMFGITIRIHLLFPIFVLVMWLRVATDEKAARGDALEVLIILGLLFLSVLLHEFGHCFAARSVDGDANEVLLWPLGGLANCDVPNTPRAHFITAVGGPLVNLLLCVLAAGVLVSQGFVPSFDPRDLQLWTTELYQFQEGISYGSDYAPRALSRLDYWLVLVARLFWLNWVLLLLNVLVMAFPLDGGRMLQAMLWPRMGYRQSMMTAIFIGFVFMFVVAIYALVIKDPLPLLLAWFIYQSCKQQWILLETGAEDSLFGYDFSQGYTSLEKDQPRPTRKKKPNFFQRWMQRRKAAKLQREQEREAAEEQRMDELLEKIQREGRQALTDEENRFLKRVADKYRNRP